MRDTSNLAEKRCLNVLDEMSIAAGIPAPTAFVLDYEHGANAFAAGLSTHDSVGQGYCRPARAPRLCRS
ncbi:MAG: hypothetical protein FWG81_08270 [Betaproteobacteria bacterium]|nr:hypothetical protein [Betaproteobacteria bacterium]